MAFYTYALCHLLGIILFAHISSAHIILILIYI